MDYKLVEALAAVATEGGFERAARVLHLTQSAVSQRVRLLEDQTGRILLARTNPPRPTSAGRRLLKHFRQVSRLEADLLDEDPSGTSTSFSTLPVGVNADSLATWFLEAVHPFVASEKVLLDIHVDDQEETHKLLKNGEVIGCVSAARPPMQGCRVEALGGMTYRLLAAPDFARNRLPGGLTPETVRDAPGLIFNRKDDLHNKVFRGLFGEAPDGVPAHYVPSSEKFVDVILRGWAYGMLPDIQARDLVRAGRLVELAPDQPVLVDLYWHCWNIKSPVIQNFTRTLVSGARKLLGPPVE
ncbi:MAG: LysR family transcriptional regulator ArgP [Pseudomonadota bacterium]